MNMKKVLLAGESWLVYSTHIKGFDSFYSSSFNSGEQYIQAAFEEGGYDFTFMPNHVAMNDFPYTVEELKIYDLIVLSDIGANTLLLPDSVFMRSEMLPNRCQSLKDYVLGGGALLMIGGYMTFAGIDGKGKWHDTPVQDVLPVEVLTVDDREEHPEGIKPAFVDKAHPVFDGIDSEWPPVLGYNRTKEKEDGQVLATVGPDPFVSVGKFGKGRSAVVTTDCAPHWAPLIFCNWEHYNRLWQNLAAWLIS